MNKEETKYMIELVVCIGFFLILITSPIIMFVGVLIHPSSIVLEIIRIVGMAWIVSCFIAILMCFKGIESAPTY